MFQAISCCLIELNNSNNVASIYKNIVLKFDFSFLFYKSNFILLQSQIQVNLQLRISPQHHDIVKGRNHINLLKIMEHTNTKVCTIVVHQI